MARLLLIGAVAAVFFTIYAAVDCAMTEAGRARGIPKPAWIVVIILMPVIGGILWLILGKERNHGRPAYLPGAPDDDPAFLNRIGHDADAEERIRQLEQELADLDDESPEK